MHILTFHEMFGRDFSSAPSEWQEEYSRYVSRLIAFMTSQKMGGFSG